MRDSAKRGLCIVLTLILSVVSVCALAENEIIEIQPDSVSPAPADEGPADNGADKDKADAPQNDVADDGPEEPEASPEEPEATPEEPEATPEEPETTPEEPETIPDMPEETPATDEDEPAIPAEDARDGIILTQELTVTVDKTTLFPGESARARCRVYPRGASENVKWASSDANVAKVNHDGVIRIAPGAKIPAEGEYIDIWAKASDGSLVMALQTIYVLPQVKKVKLLIGDTTVYAGDDAPFLSVFVDIQPESLFGKTRIVWQSSDPKIAMVAPGGIMGEAARIIWHEPGEVTVTVCSASNPACADHIKLTVLPPKK